MFSSATRQFVSRGLISNHSWRSTSIGMRMGGCAGAVATTAGLVWLFTTDTSEFSGGVTKEYQQYLVRKKQCANHLMKDMLLLLRYQKQQYVQCDGGSSGIDELELEYELESGYDEGERFFQTLEYHRSLLFDYKRRWFPQTTGSSYDDRTIASKNDRTVNKSAKWPRNVPRQNEIRALESDLKFCQRAPISPENTRRCQNMQFRIAAYYIQQNDDESKRLGFKMLKDLAENGHPDGMCYYGNILNHGIKNIVDANPQQAVVWWRRCVDFHKHIEATYELANAFYLAEGVPENAEYAVKLFRRAAHLGHAGAAYMLGVLLLDGVGAERDRAYSLEWLVTAAELGHKLARQRVMTVLTEEYESLDSGQAEEEKKQSEVKKWVGMEEEGKIRSVNIERRHTIGGGPRNPEVMARRLSKVAESRDQDQ